MKKAIMTGALAVAALGATLAMSKAAAAGQWVGSGWLPLGVFEPAQVLGSNGGTYQAEFIANSSNSLSWNVTGAVNGVDTCDAAALLCGNDDFIIAPWTCQATPGNIFLFETQTNQVSTGGIAGQYYQLQRDGSYTQIADSGNCPSGSPGVLAGVFLYQP